MKKVSTESQNVYVIGYNKLKQFMKDQLDKSDALTDEQIEEIYQKLLPGTQLSDAEKQEHIERIRKTYKKWYKKKEGRAVVPGEYEKEKFM